MSEFVTVTEEIDMGNGIVPVGAMLEIFLHKPAEDLGLQVAKVSTFPEGFKSNFSELNLMRYIFYITLETLNSST